MMSGESSSVERPVPVLGEPGSSSSACRGKRWMISRVLSRRAAGEGAFADGSDGELEEGFFFPAGEGFVGDEEVQQAEGMGLVEAELVIDDAVTNGIRGNVAEFVSFIDDDEVVSLRAGDLVEAAVVLLHQEETLGGGIHLVGEAHETLREIGFGIRIVFDGCAKVFGEELDVDLEGGEVVAEEGVFCDPFNDFRKDGDGFRPEELELVDGEFHVLLAAEEDVEFVVLGALLHPQAGGGEVGSTGDHVAVLVLVEALGKEEVDLRVEAFRGVRFDFNAPAGDFLDKLENAFFDLRRVFRLLDIVFERFGEFAQTFPCVGEEQTSFSGVFLHEFIHVDPHEDADFGHIVEVRANGEPAGCAEVSDECVEAGDVLVVLENTAELVQQRVFFFVREDAGGHDSLRAFVNH